jgi:hypothetical protein
LEFGRPFIRARMWGKLNTKCRTMKNKILVFLSQPFVHFGTIFCILFGFLKGNGGGHPKYICILR